MTANIDKTKQDSKVWNIPDELLQFVKQDTYSLLIKGSAGTGKTTLALTILRALNIKKNCLYISTRISPEHLFQYYPWIQMFFNQSKKTELGEGSERGTDLPIFVDARLDEPGSLFERITNELMDVKSPTIIIDSWDAIGFFMDREALMNNARVLQTWRERAGAKIIFVEETPEVNTFDFLSDGIVELRQKYYNDRKVREILFSKLRGVRINMPSYFFSINNSIFRSYDRYNPAEFVFSTKPRGKNSSLRDNSKLQSPQLSNNSYITSGDRELDDLLGGGFTMNSIVSLELDTHVNARIAMAFLNIIIANFVSGGNPILFQPFAGLDQEQIIRYLQSSYGHTKTSLIKIFSFASSSKKVSDNLLSERRYDENKKQLECFQETMYRLKKKYPKKILLSIMGTDLVQGFYKDDESKRRVESIISFIKSNSALSIFVQRHSQEGTQNYLSDISDVHLRISEINGTLFLHSEIPWSHLYAIIPDRYSGQPAIKLEPIV